MNFPPVAREGQGLGWFTIAEARALRGSLRIERVGLLAEPGPERASADAASASTYLRLHRLADAVRPRGKL